jgi:hypothetical protein
MQTKLVNIRTVHTTDNKSITSKCYLIPIENTLLNTVISEKPIKVNYYDLPQRIQKGLKELKPFEIKNNKVYNDLQIISSHSITLLLDIF